MITEQGLLLEDGSAMTTFSATALSTTYIDTGTVRPDYGKGKNLFLYANVTVACTGVGAVEFQAVLQPKTTLAGMTSTVTFTNATEICNWANHGLVTGVPVIFSNSGGGLPAALTAGKTYYVIAVAAGTFQFATTLENALAGTALAIADDGTGTHTATVPPLVIGSSGLIPSEHLEIGACVRVKLNPEPLLVARSLTLPGYRYLFAKYIEGTLSPVTGAVTAGKWRVQIVDGIDDDRYYPTGVEVIG